MQALTTLRSDRFMAFAILGAWRVSGVYRITNTVNGNCYIGSSVRLSGRIRQHLSLLRKGAHHNGHMQGAFTKYGEESFVVSVLEICDRALMLEREQAYIDALNPQYNILPVAGNSTGYKHGLDARAKMTQANRGNKRALGNRHSAETKRLLSEKASRRPVDYERMARMAEKNKGNKHTAGHTLTAEHKAKVSAGLLIAWAGDGKAPRSREAAAERLKARWADPAWKQQQAEKIRAGKAAKRAASDGVEQGIIQL